MTFGAYDNIEIQQHFQGSSFIWLTVGRNPHMRSLYRTLSEKLGLSHFAPSNDEDYKRILYNAFIQRRVFFVLDDVWHQNTFNGLDLAKGPGSVTLLTTRSEEVLKKPNVEILHVPHLSEEDSWKLFCVHAFGATNYNVPHGLREVAHLVAQECNGLPLALKVIGGAMFEENDVTLWRLQHEKLKRSRNDNPNVEQQLFEVLKLSYDDLEQRLKDCYFYFAAYPENHPVRVSELIAYWEGEGLVPRDGIDDLNADARSLLKALIKKSFIEVVEGTLEEPDCICKIHDVMRDLVFYIISHDNKPLKEKPFLFEAGQKLENFPINWTTESREHFKVEKLSLMHNHLTSLPETTFLAPNLRTLLLKKNGILSIPKDFLNGVQDLRVLDLAFCKFQSLPETFGDLKELRYLNLSHCFQLDALPESLGNIMKLSYLKLSSCHKLQTLPEAMYNLKGLKTLNLKNCHHLKVNLSMVGTLKSLQVFNISNNFSLTEIPKCFENLQALVELHLQGCKYLVCVGALPKGLQHLDLSDCPKLKELPSFEDVTMLNHLILYQCPSLTNLQGLDSLKKLVEVDLSGYSLFQKTLNVKPCRDLKVCHLIGSGISMSYDNNWLEV
jgi:disease resistance protein RPS2